MTIRMRVIGLDRVVEAMERFPEEIRRNLGNARQEIGDEILDTPGLRAYPPETTANRPPTPYYIRGQGTQYASGNDNSSQRLGTQFYAEPFEEYGIALGNRATYAPWVVGEDQSPVFKAIGWQRLIDVVVEKIGEAARIYQAWIDYTIESLNL